MNIKVLSDKILLENRDNVLRVLIYAKLLQYGVVPYENDINIILELYKINGYNNKEEQLKFINNCLEKKFKRTDQSVRNTLSKYTILKVLNKPKNLSLKVSETFLPSVECDKLVINPFISHSK